MAQLQDYEIGMIGLGVMGRNLMLNMAAHGFTVAGYDKDPEKVEALRLESKEHSTFGTVNIGDFIKKLRRPLKIMILVPAGKPVDAVIHDLEPYLEKDDIIMDGGNSYYKDTDIHARNLAAKRVNFFGIGISGGEEGARIGPSIMPGGPKEAYESIRLILETVSAKVDGEPCAAYLGQGSAGHFVKMVHNGIEYGFMQLISESYDLMKRGLGLNDDELQKIYTSWNEGDLNSYLIEITGNIFSMVDEITQKKLIDVIVDVAKQNGTGMWTSQSGMELYVPIPTIDTAVGIRNLSMLEEERKTGSRILQRKIPSFDGDKEAFIKELQHALYAGMITVYAQGLAVLHAASDKLSYHLNLETIARIWRGGCIIRAELLELIRHAYLKDPSLHNLMFDPDLSKAIMEHEDDLRRVVCTTAELGVPAPGLMSALGYIDGYRSGWLPANLIQAQRDYFGAHTYERIDAKGTYHTEWEKIEDYASK